ncbi:MAG: helix-hairpin-helix domain-containing protein [Caldilineales bacterium]|nr:helix-hairpin-helix domain-containing protein [Caldilineales bacterium]MDW8317702.1 helix-hairpin-helix domain-containing protein [Anaerolineae bacterium]
MSGRPHDPSSAQAFDAADAPVQRGGQNGRAIAATALVTSLLWLVAFALWLALAGRPQPVAFEVQPPPATATPQPTPAPTATPTAGPIWVDVGGAVAAPGLYQLPPGARVQQAIEAAGGLAADADTRSVSLARPLADGEKVYVPATGETPPPQEGPTAGSRAAPADLGMGRLDINRATAAELEALPAIGPKTAQAIVEYRQANGPFRSVEDLLKVKGIGEATLAKIRDLITVGPAP